MKRMIGCLLIALAGLLVRDAVGCDCAPPPPPKTALAQSAAVFQAKVVKIEEVGFEKKVTLQVERWWKGGEAATIIVSTSKSGASCGYGFQKDVKYLVYAYAEKGNPVLQVSLCSRTRTMEVAGKTGDLKDLGEGKAPTR